MGLLEYQVHLGRINTNTQATEILVTVCSGYGLPPVRHYYGIHWFKNISIHIPLRKFVWKLYLQNIIFGHQCVKRAFSLNVTFVWFMPGFYVRTCVCYRRLKLLPGCFRYERVTLPHIVKAEPTLAERFAVAPNSGGNPDGKIHGANMGPTWVLSAQVDPT